MAGWENVSNVSTAWNTFFVEEGEVSSQHK